MKLYIKHKPGSHCKTTVQASLDRLGLPYRMLGLGIVEIKVHFTPIQLEQLEIILLKYGMVLMDGKKARLIEKIKNIIVETVDHVEAGHKINFSQYLAGQLNCDYNYLDNLFAESTGTTIEHYIISRKIERVQELLLQDNLDLAGIALKLKYSSAEDMSGQFRQVTGLTPMAFKQIKYN